MVDGILNGKAAYGRVSPGLVFFWCGIFLLFALVSPVGAEVLVPGGSGGMPVGLSVGAGQGAEGENRVVVEEEGGAVPGGVPLTRQLYLDSVVRAFEGMGAQGGVVDLTSSGMLPHGGEVELEELRARFNGVGYRLRVGFLDGDPQFSIGDFTNRLWDELGCGLNDVVILATRSGLHARSTFLSYAEIRKVARAANPHFAVDPVEGIYFLAEPLMEGVWGLRRKRSVLGGIALGSGLGILLVVFLALVRRRRGGRG